jgi:predicted MFS family arabinose efflux permease
MSDLRWRLSLLMFLQYAPSGAMLPLFTYWLQELAFTPREMGWACATQPLAAMIGPLVAGQVADRWFPAERCVTVCALLAGGMLWVLAGLTTPLAIFCASLGFWLLMVPALTLGTAISFAHLQLAERDFGRVRLWGTVGWVMPAWLLWYWLSNPAWLCHWIGWLRPEQPTSELADVFRLASILAVLHGLYSLTLPHTPPTKRPDAPVATLAALRLLRDRAFAVYCVCILGVLMTTAFTSQVTPLLLAHLGIPRRWIMPTLTIAQSTEVLSLAVLPVLLLRLGIRGTMLLGLAAWTAALGMLTIGHPVELVVGSLAFNGLLICGFWVTGQVFVNSLAHGDIRASAQALLTVINGLGLLAGNLLVAWVREQVQGRFSPTFAVGLAIAAVLLVVFFVGFRPAEER